MKSFTINYPDDWHSSMKCVYKITVGDFFYYGSTVSYEKRVKTHISTMNTGRTLNKRLKTAIKSNKSVTFDVVYASDDMKDVVAIEDFFVTEHVNNPKSLNVSKSAYQNQRWHKELK